MGAPGSRNYLLSALRLQAARPCGSPGGAQSLSRLLELGQHRSGMGFLHPGLGRCERSQYPCMRGGPQTAWQSATRASLYGVLPAGTCMRRDGPSILGGTSTARRDGHGQPGSQHRSVSTSRETVSHTVSPRGPANPARHSANARPCAGRAVPAPLAVARMARAGCMSVQQHEVPADTVFCGLARASVRSLHTREVAG